MTKRSIPQKDVTVMNIYTPNNGTLNYIKQILTDLKREIDNKYDNNRRLQCSIFNNRWIILFMIDNQKETLDLNYT